LVGFTTNSRLKRELNILVMKRSSYWQTGKDFNYEGPRLCIPRSANFGPQKAKPNWMHNAWHFTALSLHSKSVWNFSYLNF